MVRAYRILEVDDLAADALKVLRLNYPQHPDLALLDAPGGYPADQSPPFWKFW
jgi:outer membrane protein assembly factor BamD (BamD/ComL family)